MELIQIYSQNKLSGLLTHTASVCSELNICCTCSQRSMSGDLAKGGTKKKKKKQTLRGQKLAQPYLSITRRSQHINICLHSSSDTESQVQTISF